MEGCGETKTGPRARTGCCPFPPPRNQAVLSLCPTFLAFLSSEKECSSNFVSCFPSPGNASVQELKSHSWPSPQALDKSIWSYFYKILSAVWNDMRMSVLTYFWVFASLETELLNVLFTVSPVPRIAYGIKSLSNKYLLKKCINNSSLRSFQTWFLTP